MSLTEQIHGDYVHNRRVRTLCRHLSELLPENASVLDVGSGDGKLDRLIMDARSDVGIRGMDVLVREGTAIPTEHFDGSHLPCSDASYDVVMFVDVLHHTPDPMVLLTEAARVARRAIVLKDHTMNGLLAGPTLRFMDRVGNARYGVSLPYNYWPLQRWQQAFETLKLRPAVWRRHLGLYPFPANLLFGRSLHFVARLEKR